MATFVLVHGAWSGAHSFRAVRPLLQAHGHAVFTPSLTGLGERAHLVHPQVNLSTHVQDVVNALVYEDLTGVTLLGHSYGGAVVTGCLDHVADRVSHLVYLDAFVPQDGQTVFAALGVPPPDEHGQLQGNWLIPPVERTFRTEAETAFAVPRRRPQPVETFREAVRLARPLESYPVTLTYVKATLDARDAPGGTAFWEAAEHARASDRWRYQEIASNHMVAHNAPEDLVAVLLETAALEPTNGT